MYKLDVCFVKIIQMSTWTVQQAMRHEGAKTWTWHQIFYQLDRNSICKYFYSVSLPNGAWCYLGVWSIFDWSVYFWHIQAWYKVFQILVSGSTTITRDLSSSRQGCRNGNYTNPLTFSKRIRAEPFRANKELLHPFLSGWAIFGQNGGIASNPRGRHPMIL